MLILIKNYYFEIFSQIIILGLSLLILVAKIYLFPPSFNPVFFRILLMLIGKLRFVILALLSLIKLYISLFFRLHTPLITKILRGKLVINLSDV